MANSMLDYHCNLDLACTYAMKHTSLAIMLCNCAIHAAHSMNRPDLVYTANELLTALYS